MGIKIKISSFLDQLERTFLGAEKYKEKHELSFWRKRLAEEGTLTNSHYEAFYTKAFNLTTEFYRGKKVLDIGCGPRGSLEWADMASERIGLDPLVNAYKSLGIDRHKMKYVNGAAEKIPSDDNYFDIVTSFNNLDHVHDLDKSISEIIRVIKPGGHFLLCTDLNHAPTATEPVSFSWDIVKRFAPQLAPVSEIHYESFQTGIYENINAGIIFDHNNPAFREGVLLANFRKLSD
jgi:ubiquinone/menaquinone biosynthesis C-methylase UbiE